MSRRESLRRVVRRLTGFHVYRTLPRGVELFEDLARAFPEWRPETVFDVGANVGQSAREYLSRFPAARVHCFEPVSATFRVLESGLRGEARARCHRMALGASVTRGTMLLEGTPDMFRLADADAPAPAPAREEARREEVAVSTVDEVARAEGIARIGLLKVDTEGRDLAVLEGAAGMLGAQAIDVVQLEAGMHPGNHLHAPLEALKGFLDARGYVAFGIYEQTPEWPTGEAHLRRCNPVFVSRRLVEEARR